MRTKKGEKDKKDHRDKWWTISRGRKDTGGKEGGVLGLMRRGKSPGPSLPPTPTLDVPQRQLRVAEMQTHLPGDPDCTLDMVDVPSLRGHAVAKDLPRQQQPFLAQKRFNSLGASSMLASTPQPRAEYQRSVSAGKRRPSQSITITPAPAICTHARRINPVRDHATQRIEMYQPPVNSKPTLSKPPQRSASAMGVYAPSAPPEFKRSLSALAGSGIVLGAPASTLGPAATPMPLTTDTSSVECAGQGEGPGFDRIARDAERAQYGTNRDAGRRERGGEGTVKGKKVKTTKTKEDGKEEKKKEKEEQKKKEKEEQKKKEKNKRPLKSSGSSFEAGALGTLFPSLSRRSSAAESITNGPPMLTLEEATTDGHGHNADDDEEMEDGDFQIISATPVKCARPRPVSDDMRPCPCPRGMIEATSATAGGLLNLLDAATNDLAQLITHLDLDATPFAW
ncbi:hypothetical protein C8F01DRAFT_1353607 [Mycena amicta]|nr:hypothetical protein C8F01DRAFT_1353607 [Mycena amicta]